MLQHSVEIFYDFLFAAPLRDPTRGPKFLPKSMNLTFDMKVVYKEYKERCPPEVSLAVCPDSAHQLVVQEADVGDGQGQDLLLTRKTRIKYSVYIFYKIIGIRCLSNHSGFDFDSCGLNSPYQHSPVHF